MLSYILWARVFSSQAFPARSSVGGKERSPP